MSKWIIIFSQQGFDFNNLWIFYGKSEEKPLYSEQSKYEINNLSSEANFESELNV